MFADMQALILTGDVNKYAAGKQSLPRAKPDYL